MSIYRQWGLPSPEKRDSRKGGRNTGIRQHTEKTELGENEDEDLSERTFGEGLFSNLKSEGMHACVPHTSAYVSIRQHIWNLKECMPAEPPSQSEKKKACQPEKKNSCQQSLHFRAKFWTCVGISVRTPPPQSVTPPPGGLCYRWPRRWFIRFIRFSLRVIRCRMRVVGDPLALV
jgi:hypothetical protein